MSDTKEQLEAVCSDIYIVKDKIRKLKDELYELQYELGDLCDELNGIVADMKDE